VDVLALGLLVVAAVCAGMINSVAGGGSFLTFPGLLLAGVASKPANATSTGALLPGSYASAVGYWNDFAHGRRLFVLFGAASLAGGLLGAVLLLATPPRVFTLLVPFLLLTATLVFALSPRVLAWSRRRGGGFDAISLDTGWARIVPFALVWLVIATYGGYFGGGMGFLMLATLAAMGMTDIHAMNGLKVLLTALVNTVALVAFALRGLVEWPIAIPMAIGSALGGWVGPRLAKRVDPARVRTFIIVLGAVLTVYFFWLTFGPGGVSSTGS
jgi:uncharacterized membrane protein YfcA